jgi:ADP-ribosylglycohydrolase
MIGAIAGDIIGSAYEGTGSKGKDFPLFDARSTFTDDTVLTVAVAQALLDRTDYVDVFHDFYRRYPRAGYGASFAQWAAARSRTPYHSWGNGAAMRVSPVAYAFDRLEEVLAEAQRSAAVTHDHEEGVRGAQSCALAVFLARTGSGKDEIREAVTQRFGYALDEQLERLRPRYRFDVSCQGSVPQSIVAFLESTSYEDAVRNAISLGGDADTMACIAGAIAEAYYRGVPREIEEAALARLDDRLHGTVERFRRRFIARP